MSRVLRGVLFAGAAALALLAIPGSPVRAADRDDYWDGYWNRHWQGYRTRYHRPYVAPYTAHPYYGGAPAAPYRGYAAPYYAPPAPVYGRGAVVLY